MGRRDTALVAVASCLAAGSLILGVILLVVLDGTAYRSPSASMDPALEVGDRVLTIRDTTPERGDIVVFHPPAGADLNECGNPRQPNDGHPCGRGAPGHSGMTFVKRVVGMPGDRLKIVEGRAHVNGRVVDPDDIRADPSCSVCNLPNEIVVPDDHFYMLGDNRGQSADSREWGPVPRGSLKGRAVLRYWPPSRFGSP